MKELVNAIINAHLDKVRVLVRTNPELLTQQTPNGYTPVELAKAKGHKKIETAIARATGVPECYTADELRQLLVDYVAWLSEEYYAAGWYDSIEYKLWALVIHDKLECTHQQWWRKRIGTEELADLKFLSERTQAWAMWNDEHPNDPDAEDVLVVALIDWQPMYNAWRAKHLSSRT
ncbi:hypothetical protein D3Y59_04525 [Hymenobacter oligotrophus]|uniref:Ankyrin repeat domain-containing protein n=1 Tax=Hymenobacter oligotrophus TaxID=2319843 RepID=A0A3B7QTR1_9BACT|nr:hypothetical protein [Hymenobacter oligotrophus]AYA36388.1 hypothetical protein D3Y59_04525 [Hymenobacter oligotrophus]